MDLQPPDDRPTGAVSLMNTDDPLLLAKLTPPPVRQGSLRRRRLLQPLVASEAKLVVISAPAGSGKSVLLADWVASDSRPFVWLSLGAGDGDPVPLFTLLVHGVASELGIDPRDFRVSTPEISIIGRVVPRVIAALQRAGRPLVLVIENVHEVSAVDSRDAIELLLNHLPPQVQLAVSSRDRVWLATPGRRARRELLELGPADLAFDRDEASYVIENVSGPPEPRELDQIMATTEGWATGVYLASLSARRNRLHGRRGAVLSAAATSDYMRSEVLSRLPLDDVKFLRRSAVLDLMSGHLCDAVVTRGSAEKLESLAARNLFVLPIDNSGVWYRSHPLFRAALLDDLMEHDALLVPVLHSRAADWWEVNGSVDATIRHALAAGQHGRAANLAARHIIEAYYDGRLHAAEAWLQQIGEDATVASPMLSVLAGWLAALTGRPAEALHWLDRADQCAEPEASPQGQPAFQSVRSALRGFVCAHGVDEMASDASRVVEHEPPWSPWTPIGLGLLASARWLQGDLDEAAAYFSESIDTAAEIGAFVPLTRMLALRALLSMDRGDWPGAGEDVRRALALIDDNNLSDYATSANAFAAAARLALHRGDPTGAKAALEKAMPLRVLVTWASPWASAILRVQLLEAHLALGDPGGARIILREIDDVLHHRPHLGIINEQVERLRHTLGTIGLEARTSTLSTAELRLLPYLQTHITMQAISERLFVSRNTVATQAQSIYRKLGVSSRSEAVQRAREIGLLADSATF